MNKVKNNINHQEATEIHMGLFQGPLANQERAKGI